MAIFLLLLAVGNFFFGGFVFMQTWNWLPSAIFDLPKIGYAAGLGLMVFSALLRYKDTRIKNERKVEENIAEALVMTLFYGLALGLGFVISPYV
ncbi:hypothetical protein [Paenibacillus dendritiformis]|uniref:hypothetical protein n=1 Tax=Paenibacillus dendritiformis TaxID=130049 RepID=UPI00387E03A7